MLKLAAAGDQLAKGQIDPAAFIATVVADLRWVASLPGAKMLIEWALGALEALLATRVGETIAGLIVAAIEAELFPASPQEAELFPASPQEASQGEPAQEAEPA